MLSYDECLNLIATFHGLIASWGAYKVSLEAHKFGGVDMIIVDVAKRLIYA